MSDESDAKSLRFFIFLVAVVVVSAFFFAFKVNACTATKESCKDEFFKIENDHIAHTCTVGARAEFITSPPAPFPGIVCHCINTSMPAGDATADASK